MRQFDTARSRQMVILKEETLEAQGKEFKKENHKQSFVKNGDGDGGSDSDSAELEEEIEDPEDNYEEDPEDNYEEDLEEDPEEDLEEDPEEEYEEDLEEDPDNNDDCDGNIDNKELEEDVEEEEPEEDSEEDLEMEHQKSPEEEPVDGVNPVNDQEEDSIKKQEEKSAIERATPFESFSGIVSAEHLTSREDEDPSAECVFKRHTGSETSPAYQNVKQKTVVDTAVNPSLSQDYCLGKNRKDEEAVKQACIINNAATDQHSAPGRLQDVGDPEFVNQSNSGKRRRSRWDQCLEDDKKKLEEDDKKILKKDDKDKKRKTRWDADDSMLRSQEPIQLTESDKISCESLIDLDVQALQLRISEISNILPPPADNKFGIRVYGPEMKLRKKLIKEREKILLELAKRNVMVEIPSKNKHTSFRKSLYIPVKEFPTYNFVGLILGPKGNTQKRMEMESGAKIRLRGRGSVKASEEDDPSDDKDLHVFIEATSKKSLDAAVCMVEKLLIPIEEGMNEHKRAQLQELHNLKAAGLITACSVCKETGHNHFVCPQNKSTLKAACDACGSFNHPTSGCPVTALDLKIKSSNERIAANLYVGFLPQTINDSRLRELFSPFGTITQSRVVTDQITGYSKGYGFVRFDTPTAASLAITHMDGYQIDGHRLAVRIAGSPPTTGSSGTDLLPINPIVRPPAVATSLPALPHYVMPGAQVSIFDGEALGFSPSLNMDYSSQFPQTAAPVIPQRVSGSIGLRTAYSSDASVLMSTDTRTAFLPTGLLSRSTESRTALPSTGVVSRSAESKSTFLSTNGVSMFPGDPDYPGSGFQSYFM